MVQTLSPQFERLLQDGLKKLGADLQNPARLAAQIQQLSDFYLANPGALTPWQENFALPASLAYFTTLNYARLAAALRELHRFVPSDEISEIWDFGSGLGVGQWALEDQAWLTPRPLYSLELAAEAARFHRELSLSRAGRWTLRAAAPAAVAPGALAMFSYSFLEMQKQLPALDSFSHLLIVEPSTRDCGRALMEWRSRLIGSGFTPLAPCTHSLDCPLLVNSPRDWCHQRIFFEAPEWWRRLEDHLPMKNRTLTYSYLLLSRTVEDSRWRGATRVIGDTLVEKGKTRQLICRGPRREFLSWLHRFGPPPDIAHGSLLSDLGPVEPKGGELRVAHPLEWTE